MVSAISIRKKFKRRHLDLSELARKVRALLIIRQRTEFELWNW